MLRMCAAQVPASARSRLRASFALMKSWPESASSRTSGWTNARVSSPFGPLTFSAPPSSFHVTPLGNSTSSLTCRTPMFPPPLSVHVGKQAPADPELLGFAVRDDALGRRQDEDAEVLRGQVALLELDNLAEAHGEPGAHGAAPVDLARERHGEGAGPAVLDEGEGRDVALVLHDLEDPPEELRGGLEVAGAVPRELRVADSHEGVGERVVLHGRWSSSLAVLLEADLGGDFPEALAAQVHPVAAHDPALAVAALAALAPGLEFLSRSGHIQIPSAPNFSTSHPWACLAVIRCVRGMCLRARRRFETRPPGRRSDTQTSIPKIPISGLYFWLGKIG